MRLFVSAAAFAAIAAATPASATRVYEFDFETLPTLAPGVAESLTGAGFRDISQPPTYDTGEYGLRSFYYHNNAQGNPAEATVLTLSNLPTHDHVDIGMIFAFINSWDGNDGSVSPDLVDIVVDGTTRVSGLTYNNNTAASGRYIGGGTVIAEYVQAAGGNFYSDTVIDLHDSALLSFAHTSSTLTLSIFAYGAGWQGSSDESWGIDDLTIDVTSAGVPEPATWAMMIGGIGFAGGSLRRRKATAALA